MQKKKIYNKNKKKQNETNERTNEKFIKKRKKKKEDEKLRASFLSFHAKLDAIRINGKKKKKKIKENGARDRENFAIQKNNKLD